MHHQMNTPYSADEHARADKSKPKKRHSPYLAAEIPMIDAGMLSIWAKAAQNANNSHLTKTVRRLDLLCSTPEWAAAQAMPKGKPRSKERAARASAFKAILMRDADADSLRRTKDIISFMSKVSIDDSWDDVCWAWTGADKGNGYGHTSRGPAHRRSYEIFKGAIPPNMDICHECDNRSCVNPSHLFVETRLDNMQDAKRKGRTATGDRLGNRRGANGSAAKLTWPDVTEIRSSDAPSSELSVRFGVTPDNINRIRRNETWCVSK
jgi:hypothetical protein